MKLSLQVPTSFVQGNEQALVNLTRLLCQQSHQRVDEP
jgi:hypothetical protein